MKIVGTKEMLVSRWREQAEAKRKFADSYPERSKTRAFAQGEAFVLERCANELEAWQDSPNNLQELYAELRRMKARWAAEDGQ